MYLCNARLWKRIHCLCACAGSGRVRAGARARRVPVTGLVSLILPSPSLAHHAVSFSRAMTRFEIRDETFNLSEPLASVIHHGSGRAAGRSRHVRAEVEHDVKFCFEGS